MTSAYLVYAGESCLRWQINIAGQTLMKLISEISINSGIDIKYIQLLQGDLAKIPKEHSVDALVVSAFPNDYCPLSGTLIGALDQAGLSVSSLAKCKDVDLRNQFACWLSRSIGTQAEQLNFDKILCFEHAIKPVELDFVVDIFRAIAPFVLGGNPPIRSLAMPIVATGNQGLKIEEVFRSLLKTTIYWLSTGFPISVIKLVAYTDDATTIAKSIFLENSRAYNSSNAKIKYDAFLSYSRKDEWAAEYLKEQLEKAKLRVFIDTQAIGPGNTWQHTIFEAIEASKKIVTILSDDYVRSPICQQEFNLACALQRQRGKETLFPVLWKGTVADLPLYMAMYNHIDCTPANESNLAKAGTRLLEGINH